MKLMMVATVVLGLMGAAVQAADKPLKVYILAGQSNMEGPANISTFDYIGDDPATAPLLKMMRGTDGKPAVCKNVWISFLTGAEKNFELAGQLTAGYGSLYGQDPSKPGPNIGPEFTFGIYMSKAVKEPILLIKTAWGGKSLNTDFRSPSAGPYKPSSSESEHYSKRTDKDFEQWKIEKAKATGVYYRLMMEHVKKVLADPKRVCPEYKGQGYEIAGFVLLQAWNDMVDGQVYPGNKPDRFALYSELLAHFIRDVRKDLSAPKMPFVIGVAGFGGVKDRSADTLAFRQAMAAPADMPEFKGNVVAVETAPFWDYDIEAAQPKQGEYNNILDTAHSLKQDGSFDKEWKWENYWKPIGKPLPQERIWRFSTVAPIEKKDKMEKYDARRFREITLPAGMEKWYMPDFDDSKWMAGKAPIGKGVWNHSGIKVDKFPSKWGEGEFLLMRTTFEVEDLNFDSFRIAILARQGFDVYLNGNKIHTYIWWKDNPYHRSIVLGKEESKFLKKGKNVLAAYANDQYDENSPDHYAAIDLCIEGITRADQKKLDLALEEVLSPKDRKALKGSSNAGYHYLGSAKIFAQMGKAFADALVSVPK